MHTGLTDEQIKTILDLAAKIGQAAQAYATAEGLDKMTLSVARYSKANSTLKEYLETLKEKA